MQTEEASTSRVSGTHVKTPARDQGRVRIERTKSQVYTAILTPSPCEHSFPVLAFYELVAHQNEILSLQARTFLRPAGSGDEHMVVPDAQ